MPASLETWARECAQSLARARVRRAAQVRRRNRHPFIIAALFLVLLLAHGRAWELLT